MYFQYEVKWALKINCLIRFVQKLLEELDQIQIVLEEQDRAMAREVRSLKSVLEEQDRAIARVDRSFENLSKSHIQGLEGFLMFRFLICPVGRLTT